MNGLSRFIGGLALRAAGFLGYSPAMWAAIGGRSRGFGAATSGKDVTTETANRVAAWKRGVQLISDYIGKTPFHVKSGNAKAKEHQAWPFVRRWAIWHQLSAMQFRRALTVYALTRGNGYGWIQRERGSARPVALKVLDPDRIQPRIVSGNLVYQIVGTDLVLQASDVIHIRGYGENGLVGIDPISGYARDVLGLAIAQQDYASSYYSSGGVPSTYAYSPVFLPEEQWKRLNSETGPLRAAIDDPHRIPVLEQTELRSIGVSAETTQLLGAREFSLKDIANALGLTVHKLNGEGTGGYKSLEEENRAFRDDTLDPYLCQFEDEFRKLLTEDEQANETHTVEAVRESLTRTNMADRAAYLKTAIGGPWMTPAEGRDVDSLEAIKGADVLYPPANMSEPIQGPGVATGSGKRDAAGTPVSVPGSAGSGTPEQRALQVAALTDVFARMTKRLGTQARTAARRSDMFLEFCDGLSERNQTVIESALSPVVALCGGTDAAELSRGLLSGFESELRQLYDTSRPAEFTEAVNGRCDTLEASAADLARKAVDSWE